MVDWNWFNRLSFQFLRISVFRVSCVFFFLFFFFFSLFEVWLAEFAEFVLDFCCEVGISRDACVVRACGRKFIIWIWKFGVGLS
jgi:hypothetical protein